MGIRASLCTFLLLMIALAPLANADTLNLSSNSAAWSVSTSALIFGSATSQVSSTGVFAGLPATTATFSDLSIGSQPVGSVFSDNGFLTIGGFSFDLTYINPGTGDSALCSISPPMANQSCTPNDPGTYLSAVTWNNTSATSSDLSFVVSGTVTGPGLAGPSSFTGIINLDNPEPYQSSFALAWLENGPNFTIGGSDSSATFDVTPAPPTVPEPSSLLLLGTGLAALAGMLKRSFRK